MLQQQQHRPAPRRSHLLAWDSNPDHHSDRQDLVCVCVCVCVCAVLHVTGSLVTLRAAPNTDQHRQAVVSLASLHHWAHHAVCGNTTTATTLAVQGDPCVVRGAVGRGRLRCCVVRQAGAELASGGDKWRQWAIPCGAVALPAQHSLPRGGLLRHHILVPMNYARGEEKEWGARSP
ncbi:hypothetical protein E2C01_096434 [Portunus trituberculatus]|uniref:Uncharacterized protein n=1 Tax=Portunus trituberculatus TaxID=210409 RepID=A0A5B7K6I3_PORTR|nr:hypothetical protein [Portunus trituberculatus]